MSRQIILLYLYLNKKDLYTKTNYAKKYKLIVKQLYKIQL